MALRSLSLILCTVLFVARSDSSSVLRFSNSTSFDPSSTISSAGSSRGTSISSSVDSCRRVPDCHLNAPDLTFIAWITATTLTTITYGTVYHVTNNATNTTRYTTIYNNSSAPIPVQAYPTDTAPIAVTTIDVGPSNVTLTYPSSWIQYEDGYTKYTKAPEVSNCKRTLSSALPSSPVYDASLSSGLWPVPTPAPNNTDGNGYRAAAYTTKIAYTWAISNFPNVSDFTNCGAGSVWNMSGDVLPPVAQTSALTIATAIVLATSTCEEPCQVSNTSKTYHPSTIAATGPIALRPGNSIGGASITSTASIENGPLLSGTAINSGPSLTTDQTLSPSVTSSDSSETVSSQGGTSGAPAVLVSGNSIAPATIPNFSTVTKATETLGSQQSDSSPAGTEVPSSPQSDVLPDGSGTPSSLQSDVLPAGTEAPSSPQSTVLPDGSGTPSSLQSDVLPAGTEAPSSPQSAVLPGDSGSTETQGLGSLFSAILSIASLGTQGFTTFGGQPAPVTSPLSGPGASTGSGPGQILPATTILPITGVLVEGAARISYSAVPSLSAIVVDEQTLHLGSTLTVDGHTFAIATSSGTALLLAGSTVPLVFPTGMASSYTGSPLTGPFSDVDGLVNAILSGLDNHNAASGTVSSSVLEPPVTNMKASTISTSTPTSGKATNDQSSTGSAGSHPSLTSSAAAVSVEVLLATFSLTLSFCCLLL